MPAILDERVLVGPHTRDDAGVVRLDAKRALVMTTDFFSPVVDDPYDFGRVAAANALSDVYAMGGEPFAALNLVGFPSKAVPMRVLRRIMDGGADTVAQAGALLIGGHSVEDAEPKYGLAVVGLVHPGRVLANAGARPGDLLMLTKPLGSGVLTTAIKRGLAKPKEIREVTELMATLNQAAGRVLAKHWRSVHAVTDVTGFGLLGHLLEVVDASEVSARIRASDVPVLAAARRYAQEGVFPGGSHTNLESVGRKLRLHRQVRQDSVLPALLADAQTSGGLLASVSPRSASRIQAAMEAVGVDAPFIGTIEAGPPKIFVDP